MDEDQGESKLCYIMGTEDGNEGIALGWQQVRFGTGPGRGINSHFPLPRTYPTRK